VTDQADDDRRTAMLLMAERLAELEPLARNRWLAFSDHELGMIARAIARSVSSVGVGEPSRLVVEIRAELERRGRER
jgi:hypothetical protein